jgi:hypothetical protein
MFTRLGGRLAPRGCVVSAKLQFAVRVMAATAGAFAIIVCSGDAGQDAGLSKGPTPQPAGETTASPETATQQQSGPNEYQPLASDLVPAGAGDEGRLAAVATVEIVPPIIHTTPNVQLQVAAIARNAEGTPMADPGAINWSGGGVTFSSNHTNPTTVTAAASGQKSISATIGGKTGTATLVVGPAIQTGDDRITIPHVDAGPVEAVLIDANDAGDAVGAANKCTRDDLLYRLAGSATLGRNLTNGCMNKLAVFAPGKALRFECQSGAGLPNCSADLTRLWSTGPDAVVRNLLSPVPVALVVWSRVSAPLPDAELEAKGDANYATSIYADQRAAMAFNITPNVGGADGSVKYFVAPANTNDPCSGVEQSLGLVAVAGSVNVVYVEDIIFGGASGPRGLTCERPIGRPPIIVMSYLRKAPTTLAHELAHAMGLMPSFFNDWHGGHTWGVPGFDITNLMWTEENGTALPRDQISLGQAFRMHVDARSWVNVQRDAPIGGAAAKLPSIRTGDTETCQPERTTTIPCPMLRQKVGAP